jgi:beta-glucosidase
MKNRRFAFLVLGVVAAGLSYSYADISGTVVDKSKAPIHNAVVSIKGASAVLPTEQTLSGTDGKFLFSGKYGSEGSSVLRPISPSLTGKSIKVEISDLNGRILKRGSVENVVNSSQEIKALLSGLPRGMYLVVANNGGKRSLLGKANADGGSSRYTQINMSSLSKASAASQILVVRKAGFLPETLQVSGDKDYGSITLKRDPIEDQIDEIIAGMTTDEMIAQMTQPEVGMGCGTYACGSALEGGGGYTSTFYKSAWAENIPVLYGKDNVHGMGDVSGATIFPHNIGLGATRDSALVRKIGKAVAIEMWAAHIDYNFAPAVTVPRNEKWGRTYEGFGENPELVASMGAAYIRGLQGDHFDAEWRIPATAKHFIGDGATNGGVDRGNATLTDEEVRTILLPPYIAAVEQGVQTVMASFNQINGVHQHVDSLRLTGILKVELGFDGFVIADWEGIENSRTPGATDASSYSGGTTGSSKDAVKKAINAGIDMAMVPSSSGGFISNMKSLLSSGDISLDRVKDAVRRILRVKIRGGRIANPNGPSAYVGKSENIGSAEHRAIAREAVQKSLVVLKNEKVLPLSKTSKIYLTGSAATSTGIQCGGWTQGWQGSSYSVSGATSIQGGFDQVADGARVTSVADAETIVYAIGESPYAEWYGDFSTLYYSGNISLSGYNISYHANQINTWKESGKKVVVVFITGRPLPVTEIIEAADAFVVAWLPGSEGAGVADVLFGDVKPTGKLPHTWPKTLDQIPINDGDGKEGLFPYGFGLTY